MSNQLLKKSRTRERFSVATVVHEDRALVQVAGDLDAATVHYLRDEFSVLRRRGIRRFTIDLDAVGFVDTAGLRSIAHLAAEPMVMVALAGARGVVLRLIGLTNLDTACTMVP